MSTADKFEVGGGMVERALHVFVLCDTSTSMRGNRIGTLNHAMRDAIPALRDAEDENSRGSIFVRTLEFSNGARWTASKAVNVHDYTWTDLVANGVTDMGVAFRELADALTESEMPNNGFAPILILVTDGVPTDDYKSGLQALNNQRWARAAVRCAISVGAGTDEAMLREFLGNDEYPLLQADNVHDLIEYIRWATVALSKYSSQALSEVEPESASDQEATTPIPEPPEATANSDYDPNEIW